MSSIYETFDYGYDPSIAEPVTPVAPPRPATLPASAFVNSDWLPPVGHQTMPNCFVWSSTYGAVTFWAAQANQTPPSPPSLQANPDYTYIKVQESTGVSNGTCEPGSISKTLTWVENNKGTPSVHAAANLDGCQANWKAYGSTTIASDTTFAITGFNVTTVIGADGLSNMQSVIALGVPLAYCTYLYTDFPGYDGTPSPYVGNGQWLINKNTGKYVGHCMLIIGYDNDYASSAGAVLIQNSFGTGWGEEGFVWMAYDTFQAMAQGPGGDARPVGKAFWIPAAAS
jgi:hypothetical protein